MLILVVDVIGVASVTIVPLLTIFKQNFEEGENYLGMRLAKCGCDTDCGCMECRKNYPPHPKIDFREQQRGLWLLGSSEDDIIRYYGCTKHAFPFMVHFLSHSKSTNENDFFFNFSV